MISCRDETRDVRHIHHKVCAHAFGDVREAREIDDAAVRRSARENELRLIFGGLLLHVRKVDEALRVHVVEFHIEELAAEIDGRAVRQVAAVIERHGEDRVARLQYAHIRREIRVRTAVRLDVHMVVGMEHLFPHGAAVFLKVVHDLAAAVVAAAVSGNALGGIALGVLVRETRADGAKDILAHKIFARDQLNGSVLPRLLAGDIIKYFGWHGSSPFHLFI